MLSLFDRFGFSLLFVQIAVAINVSLFYGTSVYSMSQVMTDTVSILAQTIPPTKQIIGQISEYSSGDNWTWYFGNTSKKAVIKTINGGYYSYFEEDTCTNECATPLKAGQTYKLERCTWLILCDSRSVSVESVTYILCNVKYPTAPSLIGDSLVVFDENSTSKQFVFTVEYYVTPVSICANPSVRVEYTRIGVTSSLSVSANSESSLWIYESLFPYSLTAVITFPDSSEKRSSTKYLSSCNGKKTVLSNIRMILEDTSAEVTSYQLEGDSGNLCFVASVDDVGSDCRPNEFDATLSTIADSSTEPPAEIATTTFVGNLVYSHASKDSINSLKICFTPNDSFVCILKYQLEVSNFDNYLSSATISSFVVWSAPKTVTLSSPKESEFPTAFGRLMWESVSQGYIGCNANGDMAILKVYLEPKEDVLSRGDTIPMTEFATVKNLYVNYFVIEEDHRLKRGTTYLWRIATILGTASPSSNVLEFTTKNHDCAESDCVHGLCDDGDEVPTCVCEVDYSGFHCNRNKATTMVIIIVSVAVPVAFLVIVVFLLVLRRRKRKKTTSQLKKPDFESLRIIHFDLSTLPFEDITSAPNFLAFERNCDFLRTLDLIKSEIDYEQLCTAFVYAYAKTDVDIEFMEAILCAEIAICKDPCMLFCSNTPASKCLYVYLRMIGLEYLWNCYRRFVQQIDEECRRGNLEFSIVTGKQVETIELGTTTIVDSKTSSKDFKSGDDSLFELESTVKATQLVKIMIDSKPFVPKQMKKLFYSVKQEIVNHYPDINATLPLGAIFFNRFIRVALTAKDSFFMFDGICDDARRRLISACKIVQQGFTGNTSNDFCALNFDLIQGFLLDLADNSIVTADIPKTSKIISDNQYNDSVRVIQNALATHHITSSQTTEYN